MMYQYLPQGKPPRLVRCATDWGNRSDGMRCTRSIPYPACHLKPDRRVCRRARAAGGMQIESVRKGRKLCYHLVQADRYDLELLTAGENPR